MPKIDLDALELDMTEWRRDFHAHPEFGFEVKRTAAAVATKLREFGLDDVVEGVGGAGVVGSLRRGSSNRAIALRADMDALRITERGMQPHRSRVTGMMHACGHDGHTAMLLGAAKLLAEEGGFDGTVRFIFQPAEEWGKGALAMLEDGLMTRFRFDEIFGLHNMPGLPVGHFATCAGPIMAAEDNFEIVLKGKAVHSARPHLGNDVMVAACALIINLQTIVSRRLDPMDTGVVSVTEIIADGTRNVLPGLARILGDVRSFRSEISAEIEKQIQIISQGTAATYNVSIDVVYDREFVPLVNDPACVEEAFAAARTVFKPNNVAVVGGPLTASEDFARFLEHVPGCFAFLGNGKVSEPLHNPAYDFNDEGLLFGARFHAAIARRRLSSAIDGPSVLVQAGAPTAT